MLKSSTRQSRTAAKHEKILSDHKICQAFLGCKLAKYSLAYYRLLGNVLTLNFIYLVEYITWDI